MSIRIGSALKRAVQKVVGNLEQTKSGLYLPPDYVAGKHFGGFGGYDPWIQACIRACCQAVRGVGQDELSELTAWAMWQPGVIEATVQKHAEIMHKLEQFGEHYHGLREQARAQISRVDGARARGTLMVIAMNPTVAETKGEIPMCVSAWNPADIEEAKAVPKQDYLIGG